MEARPAAVGGDAIFVGRARELGALGARLDRALAAFFARHPLPAATSAVAAR